LATETIFDKKNIFRKQLRKLKPHFSTYWSRAICESFDFMFGWKLKLFCVGRA
jgi:hypothetical protein